jgi:hypothetical protein
MRKRGAIGGGTLWRGPPQLLQLSWRVSSTRSQCPRAGHSGFKHCTVQPGRYCIRPPVTLGAVDGPRGFCFPAAGAAARKSWRDCERRALACQEKSIQLVGVCFLGAGNASASFRPSRLAVGLPAVEILRRTVRSAKDALRCAQNDDSGMTVAAATSGHGAKRAWSVGRVWLVCGRTTEFSPRGCSGRRP